MSLIKLALFDTKEQRKTLRDKHNALSEKHWNKMMNDHDKHYVNKITNLAKKEGVADPVRKSKIGGGIGAGIGLAAGAGLGALMSKGQGGLISALRGTQLGIAGAALGGAAGLNIGGKKERKYLHAKYPGLKKQLEKFDNQWKDFEKNHL